MHRFFLEKNYADKLLITGTDAKHIAKVLRMKVGDKLQLALDDGIICEAEIANLSENEIEVSPQKIITEPHEAKISVTLAQGLAKGDKMDFVIQKAVELGAKKIIPLALEHSVVQLDNERAEKKVERWQKIAEAAAKQSKRDTVPKISPISTLQEIFSGTYDLILLAYEGENKTSLKSVLEKSDAKNILLIIGSEGGFSEKEINFALASNAQSVSLGRRILRAETAGMVALSCIFYEKDSI